MGVSRNVFIQSLTITVTTFAVILLVVSVGTPRWYRNKYGVHVGLFYSRCDDRRQGNAHEVCRQSMVGLDRLSVGHVTLLIIFLAMVLGIGSAALGITTTCWYVSRYYSITGIINIIGGAIGLVGIAFFSQETSKFEVNLPHETYSQFGVVEMESSFEYSFMLAVIGSVILLMNGIAILANSVIEAVTKRREENRTKYGSSR